MIGEKNARSWKTINNLDERNYNFSGDMEWASVKVDSAVHDQRMILWTLVYTTESPNGDIWNHTGKK